MIRRVEDIRSKLQDADDNNCNYMNSTRIHNSMNASISQHTSKQLQQNSSDTERSVVQSLSFNDNVINLCCGKCDQLEFQENQTTNRENIINRNDNNMANDIAEEASQTIARVRGVPSSGRSQHLSSEHMNSQCTISFRRLDSKLEYAPQLAGIMGYCLLICCLLCIIGETVCFGSANSFGWSAKQPGRQQQRFLMAQQPGSVTKSNLDSGPAQPQFFQQQQTNKSPIVSDNQQHVNHRGTVQRGNQQLIAITGNTSTLGGASMMAEQRKAAKNFSNYRQQIAKLPTRLIMPTKTTSATRVRPLSMVNQYPRSITSTSSTIPPPSTRLARQQRQITADRRQSSTNNDNNFQQQQINSADQINENNSDNKKLLVCYYTTRDSMQNLPADTREYLIPSDSLAKLHLQNEQAKHKQDHLALHQNHHHRPNQQSPLMIDNLETFVPSNGRLNNQQQQPQQLLFKSASLQSSPPTWPHFDQLRSGGSDQQAKVYFGGLTATSPASPLAGVSTTFSVAQAQPNQTPAYTLIGNNAFGSTSSSSGELIDLGSSNSEAAVFNSPAGSSTSSSPTSSTVASAVPALLLGSLGASSQFFAPSILRGSGSYNHRRPAAPEQPVVASYQQNNQPVVQFPTNNNAAQQLRNQNNNNMILSTMRTTTSTLPMTSMIMSNNNNNNNGATLNRLERADVGQPSPRPPSQLVFPSPAPATTISRGVNQASTASTTINNNNQQNGARSSVFEWPESKGQIFVPQLIVANQQQSSAAPDLSLPVDLGGHHQQHQQATSVGTPIKSQQHALQNNPKFPTYQLFDTTSSSQLFVNFSPSAPTTSTSTTSSTSSSDTNSATNSPGSKIMKQQQQITEPASPPPEKTQNNVIFNSNDHNNQQTAIPLSPASSALLGQATGDSTMHLINSNQFIHNQTDHQASSNKYNGRHSANSLGSPAALMSSPLSSMFDVFGAASQYLMRFKPSSFAGQSGTLQIPMGSLSSHANIPQILEQNQQNFQQQHPATAENNNGNSSSNSNPMSSSLIISNPVNPTSVGINSISNKSNQYQNLSTSGSPSGSNSHGSSSGGSTSFLSRLVSSSFGLSQSLLSGSGSNNAFQRREDVCGRTIQTPERRIIGGEGARYGEFPYQVHIKIAKHQCGGALVDRQSIVTAAHCVYHFITRAPVNKLQIVIGAYDIEDEQYQELPPQYFKVNKVKLHPNFRFSASHPDRYDVAILKLDKPVKYTDNVLPVCLPGRDVNFESMVGTVTGFGKTDPSLSNRYGTRLLQKVDVPIIENSECERWHRTRGIDLKIFPEMMCAGYEDGLKDACVGDSGGPLVVKSAIGPNGAFRWTLAGITSAGFGCAQSRQPGIYHRVSHTVDWILENLD